MTTTWMSVLLIALVPTVFGIEYTCPVNQVLGFVKQNDSVIFLSAVPASLCGQTRVSDTASEGQEGA